MEAAWSVELIFAIILGIASFLSGLTAMLIFRKNRKQKLNNNVSTRLPSLISIEILLLLWYLLICTPLMLFLWFHFNGYNVVGSTIFIISFIPIYTTHIIRIWVLKLKYVITSLSMLNQLGMVKWKDIRNEIWIKIYHKHEWSHNISILIIISFIIDIIFTLIYLSLSLLNVQYGSYFSVTIFSLLTLCLLIGIFSIKSFNDPFNIFREEIMVLSVWFIALIMYGIFHIFLWNELITHHAWTVTVIFFTVIASVSSIFIHFHFNHKSKEAVQKNLPTLGIIVSTKEGLETFLKFLVTELSVENLEFFTLSMRWRHRLVLLNQHRQRKEQQRASKKLTQFPFNATAVSENKKQDGTDDKMVPDILIGTDTEQIPNSQNTPNSPSTPTFTYASGKQTTPMAAFGAKQKRTSKLHQMMSSLSAPITVSNDPSTPKKRVTNTSQRLLAFQKTNPGNDAHTHLQQLPFPILTFEFLDKDVIKDGDKSQNANSPHLKRDATMTETYVLEFSKTKTSSIEPQLIKKETATRTRTETVASLYLEQYDLMQRNKDRMSELSKTHATHSKTLGTTSSDHVNKTASNRYRLTMESNLSVQPKFVGYMSNTDSTTKPTTTSTTPGTDRTITKKKSVHLDVTPRTNPSNPVHVIHDSSSLKEMDLDIANSAPCSDPPFMKQLSSEHNIPLSKSQKSVPITPFFVGSGVMHNNLDNSGDFELGSTVNLEELHEGKEVEINDENNNNDDENVNVNIRNLPKQKSITVTIENIDKDIKKESKSAPSTPIKEEEEEEEKTDGISNGNEEEKKATHIIQDSDHHKQIQNTLSKTSSDNMDINRNNVFYIVDRLSVWKMNDMDNSDENGKKNKIETQSNISLEIDKNENKKNKRKNDKEINGVSFGGWFDENSLEIYDEEWTEEFMSNKTVNYDRFITLSKEINVSFPARNNLNEFFKEYNTVKKFKHVNIANYDNCFENSWKDVWQNLNDSLRRFHQSTFYNQWLETNAANGLNIVCNQS